MVPECKLLCEHFGLDPLGLLASGALLIAAPNDHADAAYDAACVSRLAEFAAEPERYVNGSVTIHCQSGYRAGIAAGFAENNGRYQIVDIRDVSVGGQVVICGSVMSLMRIVCSHVAVLAQSSVTVQVRMIVVGQVPDGALSS